MKKEYTKKNSGNFEKANSGKEYRREKKKFGGEYTEQKKKFDKDLRNKKQQQKTAAACTSDEAELAETKKKKSRCPVSKKCGGCTMIDVPYEEQIRGKQKRIEDAISRFGKVETIIKMKNPNHYRNKVTSVFAPDKKGKPVCGIYRDHSHEVIPVKECMLEDRHADRIVQSVFALLPSFKIRVYDEDKGTGLIRYVQVRTAHKTHQIMLTIVTADAMIPSRNNFVKAILKKHPEITTIVQNINDKDTTMVLGDRENILYGPGYIEDELCGRRFCISSRAFYQVNSIQTEKLYNIAIDYAGLSGKERILDAYCGIGTIGFIAADRAKEVLSVELNPESVKNAVQNAELNQLKNVRVIEADAGELMTDLADAGETCDVLFMDPPRSGASEEFLRSACTMKPAKIVYVSCDPTTLERDLIYLTKHGYQMKKAVPVDMFPYTSHVECVCLMSKVQK